MKKILLFVLGAALCACTSKNPDDIVVNVEVENMTVSNVGLLIDRSTSFTIPLDKHGKGRLVITGLGNIYPRVIYGQTAKMAFIGRGEEVTLRFDGRKFKDGFRVEGRNVEANEYLQTMTLSEFNAYDLPWEEFYAEINRLADDAVHLMYNPQIQISAESETKRSIFRKRDKTKRSKKESAQHSKSRNKSFVMTSVSAL